MACGGGFAMDCKGCGWSPRFLTLVSIEGVGAVSLAGWAIAFAPAEAAGSGCTTRSACMAWPALDPKRAPVSGAGAQLAKGVLFPVPGPVFMSVSCGMSRRVLA